MTRVWWRSYDWPLFLTALAIAIYGVLVIFSANLHASSQTHEAERQGVSIVIGLGLAALFSSIDYRRWQRYAVQLYVINLVLLIVVMHGGHSALGAQRWISLGPLGTVQPSEPAKLILAITTAAMFARRAVDRFSRLIAPLIALAVPAVLILKQPDLGTALLVLAIFSGELFFAAERLRIFAVYGVTVACAASIVATTSLVLKPFQRDRLLIFLHPNTDLQGAGYNLHQAEIAIGSGGMFGKGLTFGTQTQLGFVPEHSRDFIFTVVGEELGLIGGCLLLGLFALLLGRGMLALGDTDDRFGRYLCAGILAMLAAHIITNIGMTIGVMPVTGIPLPFVSYGGSAIMTDFAALGILLNVRRERHRLRF